MLFTRDGHNAFLGDMYRGVPAFLICSGPSLITHDLSRLNHRGILTYSVNNAATVVRTQLWTSVDDPGNFADVIWRDPAIMKLVPSAHFEKKFVVRNQADQLVPSEERVGDMPAVFGFRRNENFVAEQWLYEDTFNWGNHGEKVDSQGNKGSRSVMYVALRMLFYLGVRKVFLLGCDFKMELGKQNYAFPQDRSPGSVRGNNSSYRILNSRLIQLKPYFEREGFDVYNCTPDSGLTVFPYMSFDAAIEECSLSQKIITSGMYDRKAREEKKKKEKLKISPSKVATKSPVPQALPIALKDEVPPPVVAPRAVYPNVQAAAKPPTANVSQPSGDDAPAINDITLVTVADKSSARFLELAWQTWRKFKTGFVDIDTVVLYDPAINPRIALPSLARAEPRVRFIAWPSNAAPSHREQYLTSWIMAAVESIRTPLLLKLDADVLATNESPWLHSEWFKPDWQNRNPVIIANAFSIRDMSPPVAKLNEWATRVEGLKELPPVDELPGVNSSLEQSIRTCSWMLMARTAWVRHVAEYLRTAVNIERTDAYPFYCAMRRAEHRVAISMPQFGWAHHRGRWRSFAAQADSLLNLSPTTASVAPVTN